MPPPHSTSITSGIAWVQSRLSKAREGSVRELAGIANEHGFFYGADISRAGPMACNNCLYFPSNIIQLTDFLYLSSIGIYLLIYIVL